MAKISAIAQHASNAASPNPAEEAMKQQAMVKSPVLMAKDPLATDALFMNNNNNAQAMSSAQMMQAAAMLASPQGVMPATAGPASMNDILGLKQKLEDLTRAAGKAPAANAPFASPSGAFPEDVLLSPTNILTSPAAGHSQAPIAKAGNGVQNDLAMAGWGPANVTSPENVFAAAADKENAVPARSFAKNAPVATDNAPLPCKAPVNLQTLNAAANEQLALLIGAAQKVHELQKQQADCATNDAESRPSCSRSTARSSEKNDGINNLSFQAPSMNSAFATASNDASFDKSVSEAGDANMACGASVAFTDGVSLMVASPVAGSLDDHTKQVFYPRARIDSSASDQFACARANQAKFGPSNAPPPTPSMQPCSASGEAPPPTPAMAGNPAAAQPRPSPDLSAAEHSLQLQKQLQSDMNSAAANNPFGASNGVFGRSAGALVSAKPQTTATNAALVKAQMEFDNGANSLHNTAAVHQMLQDPQNPMVAAAAALRRLTSNACASHAEEQHKKQAMMMGGNQTGGVGGTGSGVQLNSPVPNSANADVRAGRQV